MNRGKHEETFCRASKGIKQWTSTRRGPEALTLKVDRGAWNVGSNNPESTLGISELQPFEVDHDTCKILARALPKMVSLALSSLLNVEGENIDVRAHYQRMLCARGVVCRLRPGSITTRRQGSGLILRNLRIRIASGCFAQGKCRHSGSTGRWKNPR